MFKNKKGSLIPDFFGAVQRVISWFINTAPKPLKIIFFLFFLLSIGFLISSIFNYSGYFCDSDGNLYKTGVSSLITNFDLRSSMPSNDDLNNDFISVDDVPVSDRTLVRCGVRPLSDDVIVYEDDSFIYGDGSRSYFYYGSGRCVDCDEVVNIRFGNSSLSEGRYCADDKVYRKPDSDKSFLGRLTCGSFLGSCDIPEGFYFDSFKGGYVCDSPLCGAGSNSTPSVADLWRLKLLESGAKIVKNEYELKDYRNVVKVTCVKNDVEPKLTFFGFDVFDFKSWLALIILGSLLIVFFKIKK